ncbi:MAG TPA: polysaccharide pyruvyl transferase family protein [Noviherbaspirillum sp.]|nr:polysaccharide pyruvyl transferase family protein [Noviherbaspirillum sp.]
MTIPTILFGAFDRHNFGDLLFPHVAVALLGERNLIYAGLAERDLRCYGGHRVSALARLVSEFGEQPVDIIHVGGELLGCDAWQAAVMLLPPGQEHDVIARLGAHPQERAEWAHARLGTSAFAPYSLSRTLFPRAHQVIYNAVGGVDLDKCDPALRNEVLANLKAADQVSVRDRRTQVLLANEGIAARLMPDPAVMVAELFGPAILRRAQQGEVALASADFPQGYVAVQFSADFGDEEILGQIAAELDQLALSTGLGVVFFRAGAAPWHDELHCYRCVAARMRAASTIFTSLDAWDICALIAGSHAYLGSSLHGRIIAMAFALPRMNLRPPWQGGQVSKQTAFATTWEDQGTCIAIDVHDIAQGMQGALATDIVQLQRTARNLAVLYRQGFTEICAGLA